MGRQTMTLDGQKVKFTPGQTILEVAEENGVHIPTLCRLKGATPTGACRMCLVEVKGARSLASSCTLPAGPGMEVRTATEKVESARRLNVELLLSSGDHNCVVCEANGDCRLQDLAYHYGIETSRFARPAEYYPVEDLNPFIIRDFSKCILCGRCVQACNEIQVNRAISFAYRGSMVKVVTSGDRPYHESDCVFCGECLQVCPVGALTEKKAKGLGRSWEFQKVRTTCSYCGVGCQLLLHVRQGRIAKVTGAEGASPNQGRLCVKGRFGYDFIYAEDRLKTPLIKENGEFREATWDEALDLVADRFRKIMVEAGPDALAGVSCARALNEDSYNMQKLFRAVFKTNNIDLGARGCHAPTMAGLGKAFGSGAMTNSFAELAKAKLFFVIGSNMTEAHPVAASFLKQALLKGAQLIVVDPRSTDLTKMADLHAPLKVGSDVAFLNGLMNVLITEGRYDSAYVNSCTVGFEELKAKVLEYPPERAEALSGVPAKTIRAVARKLAAIKPAMLIYTLGVTEHTCGVNNVMSCANLQMLLGNVGFECGGVNPLRGRNNVQGACDMGALPNVFPGYQAVDDPGAGIKFQEFWQEESLPDRPGLKLPEMLEGLTDGRVRALYVLGENLANTEPDIAHVEHCLKSAEFLVCQDIFPTETTRLADVVLPAAAWSEDDGTFTNSERRVSRVRKVSAPPGLARPNWWIFRELARRFGRDWSSARARDIWDGEISPLTPQMAGIKYSRLNGDGLQWPVPDKNHPGTGFLHKDGCFTRGLGVFTPVDWTPPAEVSDPATMTAEYQACAVRVEKV